MKKIIALLFIVAVAMGIAACGQKPAADAGASAAADPNAQQVKIEASNWKFDQAEYRVKKGQPVTITFDSKQGMHNAAIADLKITVDTNKKTHTFTPDKAGTYEIRCMIPCGQGHTTMVSKLIVE
ncbi:cupredoxin domain-containing protein [Paenibacillus chartarius]|uniref:Cupredoxin domain-containing protein n=1 Tax=Paenibacillus chartarius TaxID=747481 RepID=A0ABV6DEB6_9BACL